MKKTVHRTALAALLLAATSRGVAMVGDGVNDAPAAAALTVGIPLPLALVAHEGSTLLVAANGLRLLRGRPHPPVVPRTRPAPGRRYAAARDPARDIVQPRATSPTPATARKIQS